MPRVVLDVQLHKLLADLMAMGDTVEGVLERSIRALFERESRLANEVIEERRFIHEVHWALEEECYRLLATQQPMATDLRTVGAVLSVVSDVERIGEHAVGIARIVIRMADEARLEVPKDIRLMSGKCRENLRLVLRAFADRDEVQARRISDQDDDVDAMYRRAFAVLLRGMVDNPGTIDVATHLIWVAHKLERIHDRITNIGERAIFMVTGRMEELNVKKPSDKRRAT